VCGVAGFVSPASRTACRSALKRLIGEVKATNNAGARIARASGHWKDALPRPFLVCSRVFACERVR